jgi:hypothetical protein
MLSSKQQKEQQHWVSAHKQPQLAQQPQEYGSAHEVITSGFHVLTGFHIALLPAGQNPHTMTRGASVVLFAVLGVFAGTKQLLVVELMITTQHVTCPAAEASLLAYDRLVPSSSIVQNCVAVASNFETKVALVSIFSI